MRRRVKKRMEILEAAAYCCEVDGPEVPEVDFSSPFPSLPKNVKYKPHPQVKKWVNRLRRAVNEGKIPYLRQNGSPRGEVLFRQDDLDRWIPDLFPRQLAR
jgi:hypothetical protein